MNLFKNGKWVFVIAVTLVAAGIVSYQIVAQDGSGTEQAAVPDPAQGLDAEPPIVPLTGPWVVAVQPGHWKVAELPDELYRLRNSTGAQWGSVREVDINKAVADALVAKIREAGWTPVLVPATVPPGLRADAFVAIHADWGDRADRRGWKLAPAWRASGASRQLAAALAASFGEESNMVEDVDGVTVNMRGYFAFNSRRFEHASSPYTPAVLIEMGFITNPVDRKLLTTQPGYYADIVMRGLQSYFRGRNRSETDDLRPQQFSWVSAAPGGAVVRRGPSADSPALWTLDAGTVLMPVDQSGEWYEVFVRRHFATGWIRKSDTVTAEDPHWPMPGERRDGAAAADAGASGPAGADRNRS
ncbi:N-acetylmuramoyl-L-alanine amidase [Salinispira pacifica]